MLRRFNIDVGIYPNLLTGSPAFGKVFCGNQNSSSISVISDSLLGIAATPNAGLRAPDRGPTIVRGVLFLPASGALLDLSGHKVMGLVPGANDLSVLAPGIYFVRTALSVYKVVLIK